MIQEYFIKSYCTTRPTMLTNYFNSSATKIVVYESDGSPLQRERARQLRLHVTKHKVADTTSTDDEKALIIPDDSIVKYSIPTSDEDEMVTVRVSTGP